MMVISLRKVLTIAMAAAITVSLSGCYSAGRAVQTLAGMGKDRCERSHPIYAQTIGYSCYGVYPNLGVTRENANDRLSGMCALLFATNRGRYDIFEALVRAGADPTKCGQYYEDRFFAYWVGSGGSSEFLDQFKAWGIKPSDPQALLRQSAGQRRPEGVSYAIELGANPNQADEKGILPLRHATVPDQAGLATLRTLISAGADPNLPSPSDGVSAIHKICYLMLFKSSAEYEEHRHKLLTALGKTEADCAK